MNIKSQATIYYTYNLEGKDYKNISSSNTLLTPLKTVSLNAKKMANVSFYKPGDVITYTILVNNQSSFSASEIQISDKFKNQLLLEGSVNFDFLKDEEQKPTLKQTSNSFILTLPHLQEFNAFLVTYKTKVIDDLSLEDEIESYSEITSKETNKVKTNTLSLKQKYAKIICEKSISNDFAYLNTNLTYKITVKNIGNFIANDIELVDELPETFELDKSNPILINNDSITDFIFNNKNSILKVPLKKLDAGEQIEIFINGKITK